MNLVKIIEDELNKIYSKSVVINLCKDKVTDYERGIVAGSIDTLNKLRRLLTTDNVVKKWRK